MYSVLLGWSASITQALDQTEIQHAAFLKGNSDFPYVGYSLNYHLLCGGKGSHTVTALKQRWVPSVIISLLAAHLPNEAHLQIELTERN